MSNSNSERSPFLGMIDLWIEAKQFSIRNKDWNIYRDILQDSLKRLSVIYSNGTKEWFLEMVGRLIKTANGELKELAEREKSKEIPF